MSNPFIHHVSVISSDRHDTFEFYHKLLGLDFLLKTVNQDDLEMMHLFFGDTTGRPGTEFSVFEMRGSTARKFGTNQLERTIFAVPTEEALSFWETRLNEAGVFNCEIEDYNGSKILRFEDKHGVLLGITAVEQNANESYYAYSVEGIPAEFALYGIHAVHCRVRYPDASAKSMLEIFDAKIVQEFEDQGQRIVVVSSNYDSLFNQEIHFVEDRTRDIAVEGSGSIQHIAINARDEKELYQIEEEILKKNYRYSGIKNREFFKSLYYREPNSMLIEVATEQTNFIKPTGDTSNLDNIPLMLPPFLEARRSEIESKL